MDDQTRLAFEKMYAELAVVKLMVELLTESKLREQPNPIERLDGLARSLSMELAAVRAPGTAPDMANHAADRLATEMERFFANVRIRLASPKLGDGDTP